MANTQNAFGLRPVRHLNGSPWNGQTTPYYVPTTETTALFIGDPVTIIGESNQNEILGYPPGTLSAVGISSAGATKKITGVVVSVVPVTDESLPYRAASTERIVHVCDSRDVIFEVQDDGGGSLTYDTVGLNAVLIAGSGSTVTGQSGWALDGGTSTGPGADATYQLTILNLSQRITGNDLASDYAIWDVLINLPTYAPSAGVGVA